MTRRLHADRRGISPVVATVILVAVTIVVAVAVAYWMGGLTAIYTRFEKLEITAAYAEQWEKEEDNITTSQYYNITLNIKNSGSADATIDNILLNGKPPSQYAENVTEIRGDSTTLWDGTEWKSNLSVKAGVSATITIVVKAVAPFTPGTSIEVKIHTAAGQEYPKTITLP
ncbi:MAG: archaellin/type IV pilin N-terminal domain-containing protein [Candidatus Bathyarchaeia archaeon]